MDIFKIWNNEDDYFLTKIDGKIPHLQHQIDIPYDVWDYLLDLDLANDYRKFQTECKKYWNEHKEEAY